MNTFSERLNERMKELGLNSAEMCRRTGIPKAPFSQYKSGAYLPKSDRVYLISKALNVSEAWLMGYDVPKTRVSIINLDGVDLYKAPLYESVSAGFGATANDDVTDYIPVMLSSPDDIDNTICIKVKGDSMSPKIEDGDIIQVRKQSSVDSGDIAVVHADILRALKQLDFITSLPKSLFCIGTGRRQVKLLHFMATHYNINANKQNGTHNILKITSLLNYTDLPTIEHLEATNNRNYEGRILTPLYTYLNQFVEDGTLLLWEPCLSKKQFATEDTDIADMSAKQTIEEAYIHFEFATNIYPTIEAYENANKDMYEHIDE